MCAFTRIDSIEEGPLITQTPICGLTAKLVADVTRSFFVNLIVVEELLMETRDVALMATLFAADDPWKRVSLRHPRSISNKIR
jgi:hypothetical protein